MSRPHRPLPCDTPEGVELAEFIKEWVEAIDDVEPADLVLETTRVRVRSGRDQLR